MNARQMPTGPPAHVVRAFGADGVLTPLDGGRGRAWRAGDVVLKPVDAGEDALAWEAGTLAGLPADRLRVATPRRSRNGSFIVDGWTATTFLEGRHEPRRWLDIIAAGERLHASLAGVARPSFVDARDDQWSLADRAAWGDAPLTPYRAAPHVARLADLLEPVNATPQVIHGDLTGNVLFADPLPPAVIDFAVYWRPAPYASAVVVADALAWEGATLDDLHAATSGPEFAQMLIRALLFRIITDWITDARGATARASAYVPAVQVAVGLAQSRPPEQ